MNLFLPDWLVAVLLVVLPLLYLFRKTLQELFILWVVARGFKNRKSKRNQNLHSYICRTDQLDSFAVSELWTFINQMMAADNDTAGSIEATHAAILAYKYVALFRERQDGSLRGLFFVDVKTDLKREGKRYNLIRLGGLLFRSEYRGGPLMYAVASALCFQCMLTHPLTPLYIIFKTFSYKSYRLAAQIIDFTYPRYNKETPKWEKHLLDELGHSYESDDTKYYPETNILHRRVNHMAQHAVADNLNFHDNPHVQFFYERNPNWREGDCLVVVSRITWMGLMNMVLQSFKRAFFQTKRRDATAPAAAVAKAKPQMNRRGSLAPDPSKRKLLRRLTTRAALKDIYSSRFIDKKAHVSRGSLTIDEVPNNLNFDEVDIPSPI
ncbi:uncharacterized protein [Oscarella lobularis]|uniref:uncharacterized protein isoform X1 n=1 Tax=Oscarella lobularis TaxID=121494 RepID=UPI0033133014